MKPVKPKTITVSAIPLGSAIIYLPPNTDGWWLRIPEAAVQVITVSQTPLETV